MKRNILLIAAMIWIFAACDNKANKEDSTTKSTNTTASTNDKTPSVKTSTTGNTVENKVEEKNVTSGETSGESEAFAQIKFDQTNHDFGEIAEGTLAKHVFKFTNTGKVPLIIKDARGSCGCTVPDWPREPISPGKDGVIKVQFNSQGRSGVQTKTVTLTTNTQEGVQTLQIKAKVKSTSKMNGPLKQ